MTAPKNGRPRRAAAAPRTRAPRLRLIKVEVLAHFVLDDGEHLREAHGSPVTVVAEDWERWSAEAFTEPKLAELAQAAVAAQPPDDET